jgi:hypothetical protein
MALKDDYVLARGRKDKVTVEVTVKGLKEFYAVPSLGSEAMKAMAQRFNVSLAVVITYAVKMILDEALAKQEGRRRNFDRDPEVVKTVARETADEIFHIFLSKAVKVIDSDTALVHRRWVSMMDKDDHELSARLVLYDTKEEAEAALRVVHSGDKKFATLYESAVKENRMELKNATKSSVGPVLWGALKGTAAAACCRTAVQIETSNGELRWAVVFVTNRRVIPIPTLSDPNVKQQCTAIAFQEKVVQRVKEMIIEMVATMLGQSVEEVLNNPAAMEIIKHIISTARM